MLKEPPAQKTLREAWDDIQFKSAGAYGGELEIYGSGSYKVFPARRLNSAYETGSRPANRSIYGLCDV